MKITYGREDIYYWFIIGMLILVSYWVYIVVAPTFEIAQKTNTLLNKMDAVITQGIEQNNLTIDQNKKIIENQNNSSEAVKGLIQQIEDNRHEQVVHLFTVLNQSNVIGNATADLILESISNVTGLIRQAANEKSGTTSGFLGGPVVVLNETTPITSINTSISTSNQSLNATNNITSQSSP
jgi:transcriptional regulator with PAS, ATPase and Fis domain